MEKPRNKKNFSKNRGLGISFSQEKRILIYRRNAVAESIRSNAALEVYFDDRHQGDPLMAEATEHGIHYQVVSKEQLNALANHQPHQGIISFCAPLKTVSLDQLIEKTQGKESPLVLILDGIEDPHNMGAILRSADAFGVDGIIIKNVGNAPLNGTLCNISTGACFYLNLCVVSNLSQAISKLKEAGFWIAASDGYATMSYQDLDYSRKLAFIVGSEGFGISKLLLKNSDYVVKIPMQGHVNSLNASVATGILLSYARSKNA